MCWIFKVDMDAVGAKFPVKGIVDIFEVGEEGYSALHEWQSRIEYQKSRSQTCILELYIQHVLTHPHSNRGSSASVIGWNRLSLSADMSAYSCRPEPRGMGEKLPMQPRSLVDPSGRMVFQVTNRGL